MAASTLSRTAMAELSPTYLKPNRELSCWSRLRTTTIAVRKPSLTTSHTQRARMMIRTHFITTTCHKTWGLTLTRADLPGRISPLKYYYMVQERFPNAKIYCAKGTDNIIKLLNGNIYLPDECKARKQLPFLVMDRPPYVLDNNVDLPPNFEVIRQSDDRVMSSTALRESSIEKPAVGILVSAYNSNSTSMITICSPISLNNHQRCCCRFQIQKGSRNCSRKVRIHVWKQRVIYWKKVPYKGEKASCSFWQITKPDLIMMMIKWWLTLITATNLQHFHSQRQ